MPEDNRGSASDALIGSRRASRKPTIVYTSAAIRLAHDVAQRV